MAVTHTDIITMIYKDLDIAISTLRGEFLEYKQNKEATSIAFAFPAYTVATLPTPVTQVNSFMVAFATDGRKDGDGANGSGVPVWYDSSQGKWLDFHNNQEVTT